MSGLKTFRAKLGKVRNRRAFTRWQIVISQGVLFDLVGLFALFLIDFSFRLDSLPRLIAIGVTVVMVVWYTLRRITPDLFAAESIVDVALLLERVNHVDTDLVAALQFDSAIGTNVGSVELQRAVVDRAATLSETLDVVPAIPTQDANKAMRRAACALFSAAIFWLAFPDHASAFWNRLWLGDANYPTRTQIEQVFINGESGAAKVLEGEAVVFRVQCSGAIPNDGVVRLRGIETGDSTELRLQRIDTIADEASYIAEGPVASEPMEFSLCIGDARTEMRAIALVRRPLVELTIEVQAPEYMRREAVRYNENHAQVFEGGAIRFLLRCTNGKRLERAQFEFVDQAGQNASSEEFSLSVVDDLKTIWELDAATSGLGRVTAPFQFRLSVVDEDGLGTYHPIEGAIRVKPDRAPTATLSSLHHVVMPNARPSVTYDVQDDFGVGTVVLHARKSESQRPNTSASKPLSIELLVSDLSSSAIKTAIRSVHNLDLSPLQLGERDKVLVWIEGTDYRGTWPGVSAISEPIELEVMNAGAVMDAILSTDVDAEQMLTDAIEKELGLETQR